MASGDGLLGWLASTDEGDVSSGHATDFSIT